MDPGAHKRSHPAREGGRMDDEGYAVLVDRHDRCDWKAYDYNGVHLDLELATLPPDGGTQPGSAEEVRRRRGALFIFNLLTMEDRREFS